MPEGKTGGKSGLNRKRRPWREVLKAGMRKLALWAALEPVKAGVMGGSELEEKAGRRSSRKKVAWAAGKSSKSELEADRRSVWGQKGKPGGQWLT